MRLKEKIFIGLLILSPVFLLIGAVAVLWITSPARVMELFKMYAIGFVMVSGLTGGGPIVWGPIYFFECRRERREKNVKSLCS